MAISAAAETAGEGAARDAYNDAVNALLDAGSTNGYVEIRDGTQPADVDTTATGTVLATITLGDPAFGASAAGVATAAASTADTSATGGSDATWFRAYDSDATAVIDGDAGAVGSGADMEIDNGSSGPATSTITAGDTVSIASWTRTYTASGSET